MIRAGSPPALSNVHARYDRAPGEPAPDRRRFDRGIGRLTEAVPGVVVDVDDVTGAPKQITTGLSGRRLAAAGKDVGSAAREFVNERKDLWDLRQEDVDTVVIHGVSEEGLRTAQVLQRAGEVEVFDSDVTIAVGPDNAVLAVAGQFFAGAHAAGAAARRAGAHTAAEALEAIAVAARDVTGAAHTAADFVAVGTKSGPYSDFRAAGSGRPALARPVRAKEVLFPLGEEVFIPGYYLELWVANGPVYSHVVEAGGARAVLFRNNLAAEATYTYSLHATNDPLKRPHDSPAPGSPHPTGTPDGFQAAVVAQSAVAVRSLSGLPQWLPDNATTTRGNNCVAYADIVSPGGESPGDVLGQVTNGTNFAHVYDTTQQPTDPENLQQSVVAMFYLVNWAHDRWYRHGFDEAAGNAQTNNFGKGGLGGDPILAEGNDFSGTDNANMFTPADGGSPTMQMYRFLGPEPDRTSNHDAHIVFHELGHYVSNRLIGNSNGLTNRQGRAMGEGWGDLLALVMTSRATDDFTRGCFAVGAWSTRSMTPGFGDNYYFGIRRYPYSARISRNPLSFRHISNSVALPSGPPRGPIGSGAPNNEVHNAGEVWCSALWEVFVNLVARHGHVEGERRMLRYVIAGLKLTPSQPTYIQARNGIISAVAGTDSTDLRPVWRAFAKRGMGTNAIAPAAIRSPSTAAPRVSPSRPHSHSTTTSRTPRHPSCASRHEFRCARAVGYQPAAHASCPGGRRAA